MEWRNRENLSGTANPQINKIEPIFEAEGLTLRN